MQQYKGNILMSYQQLTQRNPTAQKDHDCHACEWITAEGYLDYDFTFAEKRLLVKARQAKWQIKKGDKYLKCTGVYEGEFCTYQAIPEINDICVKYGIGKDF